MLVRLGAQRSVRRAQRLELATERIRAARGRSCLLDRRCTSVVLRGERAQCNLQACDLLLGGGCAALRIGPQTPRFVNGGLHLGTLAGELAHGRRGGGSTRARLGSARVLFGLDGARLGRPRALLGGACCLAKRRHLPRVMLRSFALLVVHVDQLRLERLHVALQPRALRLSSLQAGG